MDNLIVYDVETQKDVKEVNGWNYIFEMGIATCITYSYQENVYRFWDSSPEDHKALIEYLNGCTAISFNGINFDSKVLLGNDRQILVNGSTIGDPFNEGKKYGWKNFDIFTEIWKSIFKTKNVVEAIEKQSKAKQFHVPGVFNLDNIVKNTLGEKWAKLANGKTAPEKFKNGLLKSLWEYNVQDVRCEKALFEFVREHKYVVTGSFDVVKLDQF